MAPQPRDLRKGELLAILGEIVRNQDTGTLVLQRDQLSKFLYAQDGQLIFAASNASEDKFTEILIEQGKLTPDQLALAMDKKGNRTIGRTLVELGFLASSDLLDALVDQMRRIAVSAANWDYGHAAFKPGVLPPNLAKLPVATPRFVLDTALAVEDREWAAEALGGMERPLSLTTEGRTAAPALPLSAAERAVLEAVDGVRNARQIAEMSGSDPFFASRLLIGLTHLGLLEVHPTGSPTGSSEGEPRFDLNFLDIQAPAAPPVPGPTPSEPPPRTGDGPPPPAPAPDPEPPVPGRSPVPPPIRVETGPVQHRPAPPFRPIRIDTAAPRFEPLFPEDDAPPPSDGERAVRADDAVGHVASSPFKRWLLVGSAAVAVTVLALASVWYFFLRPSEYVPLAPGLSSPRTEAKSPAEETLPGPITPLPESRALPQEPAPAAALPEPFPEADAKPAAPATDSSVPKSPTAAPVPPPSASPGEDASPGSARSLLAAGRFPEAARAFAAALRDESAPFTVDVEVACQPETLAKGLSAAGGDPRFMILPYDLKGRACYRVIWGHYPDRPSAEAALASLPDFFKQNASPRVATWKKPGAR
jgi:hypothetical protein